MEIWCCPENSDGWKLIKEEEVKRGEKINGRRRKKMVEERWDFLGEKMKRRRRRAAHIWVFKKHLLFHSNLSPKSFTAIGFNTLITKLN